MLHNWNKAVVSPVHKLGAKTGCENYRDIALLSVAYDISSMCIKNRLKKNGGLSGRIPSRVWQGEINNGPNIRNDRDPSRKLRA